LNKKTYLALLKFWDLVEVEGFGGEVLFGI